MSPVYFCLTSAENKQFIGPSFILNNLQIKNQLRFSCIRYLFVFLVNVGKYNHQPRLEPGSSAVTQKLPMVIFLKSLNCYKQNISAFFAVIRFPNCWIAYVKLYSAVVGQESLKEFGNYISFLEPHGNTTLILGQVMPRICQKYVG